MVGELAGLIKDGIAEFGRGAVQGRLEFLDDERPKWSAWRVCVVFGGVGASEEIFDTTDFGNFEERLGVGQIHGEYRSGESEGGKEQAGARLCLRVVGAGEFEPAGDCLFGG